MVEIPCVDAYAPDAALQLRKACIEVGFFYLIEHRIESNIIDKVYNQMRAFFELPSSHKLKYKVNNNFRGYTPMSEETLDPSQQAEGDTKEGYYIGREVDTSSKEAELPLHGPNVFPDDALTPGFQSVMTEYYDTMSKLGFHVAQLFAEAAGAKGYFDLPGMFDRPMAALRLLHYAARKSNKEQGVYGCGAHSDYGLLTLLSTDANAGLEILHQGEWLPVPVRQDAFVVNIGDMGERWTNGLFRSTRHRVVNYTGVERYSIPFFYEPNFTCRVECLPSCISKESPAKYEPTTSGEYLLSKYRQTHSDFEG